VERGSFGGGEAFGADKGEVDVGEGVVGAAAPGGLAGHHVEDVSSRVPAAAMFGKRRLNWKARRASSWAQASTAM
jgi:hypothetical protein